MANPNTIGLIQVVTSLVSGSSLIGLTSSATVIFDRSAVISTNFLQPWDALKVLLALRSARQMALRSES